jgi:PAS domain S-box-containing protein
MKNHEEGMEKLLTIEKTISGMIELHRLVVELKELETQHQKTIEVLRASENKYRTFLENIPQKLFVKDRNLLYIYCSENYAQDLKIRPEDIAGKTDADFFPTDVAEKYLSDDKRIVESGNLEHIEDRYVTEGQSFIVHMVKTPIRDEKGNIIGLLGIFWDITEQKRNEEKLREYGVHLEGLLAERTAKLEKTKEELERESTERRQAQERFQQADEKGKTIFENTGTAMALIGEDDMIISRTSPGFEKIFGFPREEVEDKKKLAEFIAEDDLEKVREEYLAWRTSGEAVPMAREYRFIDKEGKGKDVLMTLALIPGARKIVASLQDVTERNQLEKALQRSEERHRSFVENASLGMVVIQDGRVRFNNPKGLELFGYSQEELASRAVAEIIHPEDRERFELQVRRSYEGEPPSAFAFKIVRKDGDLRWLETKMASIPWEGRPAAMNYITDITARKQAEGELLNCIEPFRALVDAARKILSME